MSQVLYKKGNIVKIIDVDWSRKQNKFFSPLHGIASYLAMFCPALPKYFIEKYTSENDVVMDNFSGRGTTALVSRELNRNFIGSDLNPYSFVLTKFKCSKISKQNIINRINELKEKFKESNINIFSKKYNEIKIFYSNFTFKQLVFIRNEIGTNWLKNNEVDNAILAFCLGLMHGPNKKDGSSIYFSINMPNTISMSPNYVKDFCWRHNIKKPRIDIFENLLNRVESKYDKILEKRWKGKMYYFDAVKDNKSIKNNSINLVFTSPPYLNIVNYTNSNWIKLWLLGYDRDNLSKKIVLSDKLNFSNYCNFIKQYLNNIYPKLKIGAKVCLVVGDVASNQLIDNVWDEIKNDISYKKVEMYLDYNYKQTHKVTNMLNKKNMATIIEKIFIIEKN